MDTKHKTLILHLLEQARKFPGPHNSKNYQIWYTLLGFYTSTPELAQAGVDYEYENIISWLQEDTETSPELLQNIWDTYQNHEQHLLNLSDVLTHPNCPEKILQEATSQLLTEHQNTDQLYYLRSIVENPNTNTDTLQKIWKNLKQNQIPANSWYKNPHCPKHILAETVKNENWNELTAEKTQILERPDGTPFTNTQFDQQNTTIQRRKAKTTSDQTLINHIYDHHPDLHAQIAYNPHTDTKLLTRLYEQHQHKTMIVNWIARNPNINPNLLTKILVEAINNKNKNRLYNIAKNPTTSPNQLYTIYQNQPDNEEICRKILQHKNCSDELKQTILQNPHISLQSKENTINKHPVNNTTIESYMKLKQHIIDTELIQNNHINPELAHRWLQTTINSDQKLAKIENKELIAVAIKHLQTKQFTQTCAMLLEKPEDYPQQIVAWNLSEKTAHTDEELLNLLQTTTKITDQKLQKLAAEVIIENCHEGIMHTNTATKITLQKLAADNHWILPATKTMTTITTKKTKNKLQIKH